MSISMVWPLAAGNAIRVFLTPPASARRWRVLRNTIGTFVDQNDAHSVLVYDGDDAKVLDASGLTNGTPYFYTAFYWNGAAWSAGDVPQSCVPQATYVDMSVNAQLVVRDRLNAFMQVEVERGTLMSSTGAIAVLLAAPEYEGVAWPVFGVHLEGLAPAVRSIGEEFGVDEFDADALEWNESEGMLMSWRLAITGWSKNPDERVLLRAVLSRFVLSNMGIFAGLGLSQIEHNFADNDQISGEYAAPVYVASCNFTCLAAAVVRDAVDEVIDVKVNATASQEVTA